MARKNQYKRLIPAAALLTVALVLYWKYSFPVRAAVRGTFSAAQSGIYSAGLSLGKIFSGDPEADELIQQNENLKAQASDLIYANAALTHLQVENNELRELLGYFERDPQSNVTARIIGSDPSLENALIINRGTEDGIRSGQAVITGNGNIVGKIINTSAFHSTVLLATDNQLRLSVSLSGANAPIGIASGELGLSVIIDLVPQNIDLKEGDIILTSALDRSVPAGLVVGKVNRIISRENDLFKKASLSPLVDYQNISIVSVITSEYD